MSISVCVCERESEREVYACVYACVCERERQINRQRQRTIKMNSKDVISRMIQDAERVGMALGKGFEMK